MIPVLTFMHSSTIVCAATDLSINLKVIFVQCLTLFGSKTVLGLTGRQKVNVFKKKTYWKEEREFLTP